MNPPLVHLALVMQCRFQILTCLLFPLLIQCSPAPESVKSGSGAGKSDERKFDPVQVVSPIRPITDAPIAGHAEARNRIGDSDLVLGVEVNGKARAYPIIMLTGPQREIINDDLGGRSIAATW